MSLNQSKRKNIRYIPKLIRTNPTRYTDFFDVTKQRQVKGNKRRKIDCGENKKSEKESEEQRYMLNEHSGQLQPVELVQNASCAKCSGKSYKNAEIQVTNMDINCKYVQNTSSQYSLITESNIWASSVVNANVCTDGNNDNSKGDVNTHDLKTKDDDEVLTAGMSAVEIEHNECNANNNRIEIDQLHDDIASDDVVLDEFNNKVYKKFCQDKLCDPDLMHKLVEVLHENSSLDDFMSLVTQLADGTLDAMNMSFLLCLDVAKLEKCKTTTAM